MTPEAARRLAETFTPVARPLRAAVAGPRPRAAARAPRSARVAGSRDPRMRRVPPRDLRDAGASDEELRAVELLTRTPSGDPAEYEAHVRRIAQAPGRAGDLARAVKRADLRDRTPPGRVAPSAPACRPTGPRWILIAAPTAVNGAPRQRGAGSSGSSCRRATLNGYDGAGGAQRRPRRPGGLGRGGPERPGLCRSRGPPADRGPLRLGGRRPRVRPGRHDPPGPGRTDIHELDPHRRGDRPDGRRRRAPRRGTRGDAGADGRRASCSWPTGCAWGSSPTTSRVRC